VARHTGASLAGKGLVVGLAQNGSLVQTYRPV
jgi:hypothetical protein